MADQLEHPGLETRSRLMTGMGGWPELDHVILNNALSFSKNNNLSCLELMDEYLTFKSKHNYYLTPADRYYAYNCYWAASFTHKAYDVVKILPNPDKVSASTYRDIRYGRCHSLRLVDKDQFLKDADCSELSSSEQKFRIMSLILPYEKGEYQRVVTRARKTISDIEATDGAKIWAHVYMARAKLKLGEVEEARYLLEDAHRIAIITNDSKWERYIIRDVLSMDDEILPLSERFGWHNAGIRSETKNGRTWDLYMALTAAIGDAAVVHDYEKQLDYATQAYNLALEEEWGYEALSSNIMISGLVGSHLTAEESRKDFQKQTGLRKTFRRISCGMLPHFTTITILEITRSGL